MSSLGTKLSLGVEERRTAKQISGEGGCIDFR